MRDEVWAVLICLAFIGLSGLIGFLSGDSQRNRLWQEECVKREFAEYNQKTGAWQWKQDSQNDKETK